MELMLIIVGLVGLMYSTYLFTKEMKMEEPEQVDLIKKMKMRVSEDALEGKNVSTIVLASHEQVTPEIKKQFGDLGMKVQVWKVNQESTKFRKGDVFVTVTIPTNLSSVIASQIAEEV